MHDTVLILQQAGWGPEVTTEAALDAFQRIGKPDQDYWLKKAEARIKAAQAIPTPAVVAPEPKHVPKAPQTRKIAAKKPGDDRDPFEGIDNGPS